MEEHSEGGDGGQSEGKKEELRKLWRDSARTTTGLRDVQKEEARIRAQAAAYDRNSSKYLAMKAQVVWETSTLAKRAAEQQWKANHYMVECMKMKFKNLANVMNFIKFPFLILEGGGWT